MSQTPTEPKNIAETVADIVRRDGQVTEIDLDGPLALNNPIMVAVPEGRRIEDLTGKINDHLTRMAPARRKGTTVLTTLDSLIEWAHRFKDEDSVLFATTAQDNTKPKLTCIANYHRAGPEDHGPFAPCTTARHGDHRATYAFPFSREWLAWTKMSGQALDKGDMGEFIEAYAHTIFDPTPAIIKGQESDDNADWENRLIALARQIDGRYGQLGQLLQMSRQFQVHETSNLAVTTNRDTGESSIQFVNEHADPEGRPLKVPNLVIIAIPVFDGGALYRIPVRFRYRKAGSTVKFILTLHNPERALDDAFEAAVTQAGDATGLAVFFGNPDG